MSSNILVPEVGESIVDARVAKWLRKEGDAVAAGDPLVELETDKIDVEVSAPHAGVLSRIDRKDGDDVKVGEVLGILDESAIPRQAQGEPLRQAPGGEGAVAPTAGGQPQQGEPARLARSAEHRLTVSRDPGRPRTTRGWGVSDGSAPSDTP